MKVITRQTAIENGLKTYFTGRKCKYGHISERYTLSCVCIDCSRENIKTSRENIKAIQESMVG